MAAIELALLSTFVFLPLAGVVAVGGQALYTYDVLAKQARAAARYIALRSPLSPTAAADVAAARNVAVCGLPACGSTPPVVPGLAIRHVAISPAAGTHLVSTGATTGAVNLVTATITFDAFQPWIGIPDGRFSWPMPLSFSPIRVTMPRPL